jgi:hypothetical protein
MDDVHIVMVWEKKDAQVEASSTCAHLRGSYPQSYPHYLCYFYEEWIAA